MTFAVVLITRTPNIVWLNFLKSFTHYDIYIMIDDNSKDYKKIYQEQYPTIHFIQIDNDECQRNGFVGSSTATKLPPVMSWDKAMYYFLIWKRATNICGFLKMTSSCFLNLHC